VVYVLTKLVQLLDQTGNQIPKSSFIYRKPGTLSWYYW